MKLYTVHVFPTRFEYENVQADNPADAESKVIANEWPDISEVSQVITMLHCQECGYDNDTKATKCDECGEPL